LKYYLVAAILTVGFGSTWIYEKIVYPLPDNGVLLSKKGNLMWYNRPGLVENQNKLYAGWMTSDQKVVVGEISKDTGHILETIDLHQWRYLDDHGAPIIHAIEDGVHKDKLISIYNLHNSEIYFQRSTNPNDITQWEKKMVINQCECTYPSILEIDKILYLFYRKQIDSDSKTRSYFMKTSLDYGDSWGKEKEIIKAKTGEWIYAMVAKGSDSTLNIAWGVHDPVYGDIQNIFYAKSVDLGASWKGIKSTEKSSFLRSQQEYLVRKSQFEKATRLWDFRMDKNNNPVLLSVDYNKNDVDAYWMQYKNKEWIEIELGKNSRHYYPCGLVFKGDKYNHVYMTKDQSNNISTIYDIEIDSEAGSYRTVGNIINNSNFGYCRPMSSKTNDQLIYTAVRSYTNYMKFDTWLISNPF